MFGFDKKKAANSYIVPQNSTVNLEQKKSGFREQIANLKENHYDRTSMNKCPHCENMAKNFLYLESLIRNNCDKNQKCSLCQSSLKYLQYVNRNIMQVFGNFDSIVQAARVFSSQAPPVPKYSVKARPTGSGRAQGGAVLNAQKSAKTLKSVKSQKSKKSLKSIKSNKSGKNVAKPKPKSKTPVKSRIPHGKMVLKSKYKSKAGKSSLKLNKQLSKVVRSASQYQNLHSIRSKLISKAKKQKKQRVLPPPTSINWSLLKRNMPRRAKPLGVY
ncbi:hypothetical protein KR222_007543 [Zaprionus bogoriensis]|nr:hypothetical protein KR222_007543 [Zaprionus bogoriensis]